MYLRSQPIIKRADALIVSHFLETIHITRIHHLALGSR